VVALSLVYFHLKRFILIQSLNSSGLLAVGSTMFKLYVSTPPSVETATAFTMIKFGSDAAIAAPYAYSHTEGFRSMQLTAKASHSPPSSGAACQAMMPANAAATSPHACVGIIRN
jgi:hypothetical protein